MKTIYICYHKVSEIIKNEIVIPIQLGAEISELDLDMQKDNNGDHISFKNKRFCELTALYWMWKNDRVTTVKGMFHYRRQLILNEIPEYQPNKWGLVNFSDIDNEYINNIGITSENVESLMEKYDLILPNPWDVRNAGQSSLYEQYKASKYHNIEDLDTALEIIKEMYSEMYDEALETIKQPFGFFTNIFIMKSEILDQFCSWLFPILFELEHRVDDSNYNEQEIRYIGYIAERLFTIYFMRIINKFDYKYIFVKRSFIE